MSGFGFSGECGPLGRLVVLRNVSGHLFVGSGKVQEVCGRGEASTVLLPPWDCHLCSQRPWESVLLLFCLLVILARLTKNPLMCGRLYEDKKMSEGNSNNKEVRTMEGVILKALFFP